MTTKSITSGHPVKTRVKQRQKIVRETSPGDSLACRLDVPKPTSSKTQPVSQRSWEDEETEVPSSARVSDAIGPTAGPMLATEEQRSDIDRIMASVNILQREIDSLKKTVEVLMDRKDHASQDFSESVDVPADDNIDVNGGLSELDALKLEIKMMQQRIKSLEHSKSTERRSSTVPDSAQVSRRPSFTNDEAPTLSKRAPSNGFVFSTTQTPMSAYFDAIPAPQIPVPKRHDAVDEYDSSSTSFPEDSKPKPVPPQRLFTTKPKTAINGSTSGGRHGPVSMPPPQTPCKASGQNINRRRDSYSVEVATRTALTPIKALTNSTSLPRTKPQTQEPSIGSAHNDLESHIYDDELDDDSVRPQSSTRSRSVSLSGYTQQPPSKTAQSRQFQKSESIQKHPINIHRRKSTPMAPVLARTPSHEYRPSTSHRESKRRKTTAPDANASNTPKWMAESRGLRSMGGRGGGQGLSVRIDNGRPFV